MPATFHTLLSTATHLGEKIPCIPQAIEELGVGLLGLVRHAGGFPHVAHNGALVSASGETVIAPPAGFGGMPGEQQ